MTREEADIHAQLIRMCREEPEWAANRLRLERAQMKELSAALDIACADSDDAEQRLDKAEAQAAALEAVAEAAEVLGNLLRVTEADDWHHLIGNSKLWALLDSQKKDALDATKGE